LRGTYARHIPKISFVSPALRCGKRVHLANIWPIGDLRTPLVPEKIGHFLFEFVQVSAFDDIAGGFGQPGIIREAVVCGYNKDGQIRILALDITQQHKTIRAPQIQIE
jgi:hypothetical protein